jgi:hypothetical protein
VGTPTGHPLRRGWVIIAAPDRGAAGAAEWPEEDDQMQEFNAGPSQTIVLYSSGDTGAELDPATLYGHVAADAELRAVGGWRIVSMAEIPLRHGGTVMGLEGSGFETKASVAVVYARP